MNIGLCQPAGVTRIGDGTRLRKRCHIQYGIYVKYSSNTRPDSSKPIATGSSRVAVYPPAGWQSDPEAKQTAKGKKKKKKPKKADNIFPSGTNPYVTSGNCEYCADNTTLVTAPHSDNTTIRVFAMYQTLLGWKTCKFYVKFYYETDELPNPRPTQPKKK